MNYLISLEELDVYHSDTSKSRFRDLILYEWLLTFKKSTKISSEIVVVSKIISIFPRKFFNKLYEIF